MPVSEKEIIERLPDWIAEKKTSFLFGSGTSAPGMPLMNMFPGKKDGSTDVDGLMYEIIKRNKFLIGAKMKINVSEEESKAILGTLGAYKKFIEITYRAMMGEFIIYYRGKIVGGIYDDRLLVKPTKSAISYMPTVTYEIPYENAKEMLLVEEVDNKDFLTGLFDVMYDELPTPKPKKKK